MRHRLTIVATAAGIFLITACTAQDAKSHSPHEAMPAGPGILSYTALQRPYTVLDHLIDHLHDKAREWASDDGFGSTAARQMVKGESIGSSHLPVDVRAGATIDSTGAVVLWGQVLGNHVSGRSPGEACTFLLDQMVISVFGPVKMDVDGQFIPVHDLSFATGATFIQDPDASAAAARAVWRNTRMQFSIYEHQRRELTDCQAAATEDGWTGALSE